MTKFTDEDLTVYLNGKPITRLNGVLAERQKVTKAQLIKLKELHVDRHLIEEQLKEASRVEDIQMLYREWTQIQRLLQMNWNFEVNDNWHPSHRLPHCICGVMDNDERLGTPYRVVTQGCPIHDPV